MRAISPHDSKGFGLDLLVGLLVLFVLEFN